MNKIKWKVFFVLLLASVQSYGQELAYDVDFVTYFDNREYHAPYAVSQTLFGTRLTPTIGVTLRDSLGGDHRLMGGVSYIQPFGASMQFGKLWPTIYYQYKQRGFLVTLGSVPYTELATPLPSYLMSDSLRFFYPNIQGALLGYTSSKGYLQFFCDWRGLQSVVTREAFRLVVFGRYSWQWLHVGGYASMNHLANKAKSEPHLGVCDDIVINPRVGIDFSHRTVFDSLTLDVGYLGGYYTDRKRGEQTLANGFVCDILLGWRFLELKNSFYVGQGQMSYWQRYGAELYQGSLFYASSLYNRTDLRFYLVRRSFVNCYFSWNLHWAKGYALNNQQSLVLRFSLAGLHRKGILSAL